MDTADSNVCWKMTRPLTKAPIDMRSDLFGKEYIKLADNVRLMIIMVPLCMADVQRERIIP